MREGLSLVYSARRAFLQASADFWLPFSSDQQWLGRLSSVYRNHKHGKQAHRIAITTSDFSLTDRQRAIHDRYFATIGCFFPHEETRNHFHNNPLTRRRLHGHPMDATLFPWPRKYTNWLQNHSFRCMLGHHFTIPAWNPVLRQCPDKLH